MTALTTDRSSPGWLTKAGCKLEDFRAVVEQTTVLADYPYAQSVEQNVLIYGSRMRDQISNSCIVEFFDPPNPDDHMVTPLSNGVR